MNNRLFVFFFYQNISEININKFLITKQKKNCFDYVINYYSKFYSLYVNEEIEQNQELRDETVVWRIKSNNDNRECPLEYR